jgi:hypothetical protein
LSREEREHVIEVIKQGDEAKLRRLRDGMGDEDSDDQEMAGASD